MANPLELRLALSVSAWIHATAGLTTITIKRRDEDTDITPETDATKAPRIIVAVSDAGRTAISAGIRNMRVEITLRQNAKVEGNTAAAFAALAGILELAIEQANLKTALDSASLGVRVMMARRISGNLFRVSGDLRLESWVLDVRAVPTELVES